MKLLIGGSPCTHWSIAQTRNRETEPQGLGWELFRNYLIALRKFRPDYFLYENNKSMAPAIRAQITKELGVEPIMINSALVSAQNRQRLYWTNIPGVEQPGDRGILLRDILETGLPFREKGYTLKANYVHSSAVNAIDSGHFPATMVAEPVNITADGKAQCLRATYYKDGIRNMVGNTVDRKTCAAEAVRIGTIESNAKDAGFDSKQYRVYSPDGKATTLCGQGGGIGAKTGLYATPVRVGDMPNTDGVIRGGQAHRIYDGACKAVTLTARPNGGGVDGPLYAMPLRVGAVNGGGQGNRIYSTEAKSCTITAQGGGHGGSGQGLYAIPVDRHQSRLTIDDAPTMHILEATKRGYCDILPGECVDLAMEHSKTRRGRRMSAKSNCLTTSCDIYEYCGTIDKPIYRVEDGYITINEAKHPIKLRDGCYIIRKLTVTECKRLQTVPDDYVFPVSNTQAYKMLGNGWTVDVIAHILGYVPGIKDEPLTVLSMYDGMSCGHLALDKLGGQIATYYATEIDKYAIQTTQHNFPDTVQLGDAFQVRDDDWHLPGL